MASNQLRFEFEIKRKIIEKIPSRGIFRAVAIKSFNLFPIFSIILKIPFLFRRMGVSVVWETLTHDLPSSIKEEGDKKVSK
jgi:hypothetical protein